MVKIILDTNFLLLPAQFNIDIFSEIDRICHFKYKLYIIDKTIDESKKIIETAKKAKDKRAAKLALQLIKHKKISIIKTKENLPVDDLILKLANKDAIIATSDIILRKKLKQKGIHLIILRKRQYLECQ